MQKNVVDNRTTHVTILDAVEKGSSKTKKDVPKTLSDTTKKLYNFDSQFVFLHYYQSRN